MNRLLLFVSVSLFWIGGKRCGLLGFGVVVRVEKGKVKKKKKKVGVQRYLLTLHDGGMGTLKAC